MWFLVFRRTFYALERNSPAPLVRPPGGYLPRRRDFARLKSRRFVRGDSSVLAKGRCGIPKGPKEAVKRILLHWFADQAVTMGQGVLDPRRDLSWNLTLLLGLFLAILSEGGRFAAGFQFMGGMQRVSDRFAARCTWVARQVEASQGGKFRPVSGKTSVLGDSRGRTVFLAWPGCWRKGVYREGLVLCVRKEEGTPGDGEVRDPLLRIRELEFKMKVCSHRILEVSCL